MRSSPTQKRNLAAVLLLLALCGILVAACGGSGEGGDGTGAENGASRWLSLLARIPDTPGTRMGVVMNDYERVRESFDISLPSEDAGREELLEYVLQLMLADREEVGSLGLFPAHVVGIGRFPTPLEELRTELGFSIADIDQDVYTGRLGGELEEEYQVLRGRFDPAAIDDAVHSDPAFSELLEERTYSDASYYSWGDDFAIGLGHSSAVRDLGQASRLAVQGEFVYWTRCTEGMEDLIDTGLGERPRLAEVEEFQVLVEGLERLDTYAALLSLRTLEGNFDPLDLGLRPLAPYVAYATGAGADENGTYVAIVLLHADEETAEENVERLERRIGEEPHMQSGEPWREVFYEATISTDGNLLLAKLHTTTPHVWQPPHYLTLLSHE